jgi:uncharacterized membrane protein YagU involved in acid resistance
MKMKKWMKKWMKKLCPWLISAILIGIVAVGTWRLLPPVPPVQAKVEPRIILLDRQAQTPTLTVWVYQYGDDQYGGTFVVVHDSYHGSVAVTPLRLEKLK